MLVVYLLPDLGNLGLGDIHHQQDFTVGEGILELAEVGIRHAAEAQAGEEIRQHDDNRYGQPPVPGHREHQCDKHTQRQRETCQIGVPEYLFQV